MSRLRGGGERGRREARDFFSLPSGSLFTLPPLSLPSQPAAAGSATSSGTAPIGGALLPTGKMSKAFNKLNLLTTLVGGGASGVKAKFEGAVSELLSAVLDNQFTMFTQPEGIFGESGGMVGGRGRERERARRHTHSTHPPTPPTHPPTTPDLGSSGAATIEWPAGNLRALTDFAAALKAPGAEGQGAIASLAAATGQMLDGLCTPESFTPQSFIPAGCSSPEVELRLVPAECLLEAASGAMTCRPAYLLLETRAAIYTGPYYAAAQWVGRSCVPYALVGPKVSLVWWGG